MGHTERCRGCMYENKCDYITCTIEESKSIRNRTIDTFTDRIQDLNREIYSQDELDMIRQACNTIAEMMRTKPDWIPVEDRHPEDRKVVEVTLRTKKDGDPWCGELAYYRKRFNSWYSYGSNVKITAEVIAWKYVSLSRTPYYPKN